MPNVSEHKKTKMPYQRLTGRDAVWFAIRKLKRFTLDDIAKQTKQQRNTVRDYVNGLTKAGYLSHEEQDKYTPHYWELVRDCGSVRPYVDKNGKESRNGIGRNNMWRTIKMTKHPFSKRDLAIMASTDDHQVSVNEANYYIRSLALAGYIHLVEPAVRGANPLPAKYRFLPSKNTGPRAPMVQRLNQVFDPNLSRVVWQQEAEEKE